MSTCTTRLLILLTSSAKVWVQKTPSKTRTAACKRNTSNSAIKTPVQEEREAASVCKMPHLTHVLAENKSSVLSIRLCFACKWKSRMITQSPSLMPCFFLICLYNHSCEIITKSPFWITTKFCTNDASTAFKGITVPPRNASSPWNNQGNDTQIPLAPTLYHILEHHLLYLFAFRKKEYFLTSSKMDILTSPFIFLQIGPRGCRKEECKKSPATFNFYILLEVWETLDRSFLEQVHIYTPNYGKAHIWILGWHR